MVLLGSIWLWNSLSLSDFQALSDRTSGRFLHFAANFDPPARKLPTNTHVSQAIILTIYWVNYKASGLLGSSCSASCQKQQPFSQKSNIGNKTLHYTLRMNLNMVSGWKLNMIVIWNGKQGNMVIFNTTMYILVVVFCLLNRISLFI